MRKSKLPDGFVAWIERNWEDLQKNPKLLPKKPIAAEQAAETSSASTPSKLRSSKDTEATGASAKTESPAKPVIENKATTPPGLHNQEWKDIKVENGSFKTVGKTDLDNLSESEQLAAAELRKQGWDNYKIEEILNSGDGFNIKSLEPGDKLYGFTTEGFGKDINSSAYWLDEAGFKDVQSKYFKDGVWDKEGAKGYLALPCYNRANAIDMAEVTQSTSVVEAKIAKATELIQYTNDSGYSTGLLGKIMGGGGTQVTLNPSTIKSLPGI